ncbi:sugar transferase [Salinibacterium sp. G-O1]|uniref:sugar transferase n=1 Tax=Salinibacterium sp. G-O1 TaxID=3046208 RepID=UPI0024BBB60D|nr:sugar transferase [Salinibacterium sp. G-O1]MDJ0333773.1 sugar transferase [Salinibacterium sp. G-O1]
MTQFAHREYPWQAANSARRPMQRTRVQPARWVRTFSTIVTASDLVTVIMATTATHLTWFGFREVMVSAPSSIGVNYFTVSMLLVVAWMTVLAASGSRDPQILGTDLTEYRRVINGTLLLFGAIGVFAAMTQTDFARGYLITAFPLGLLLLIVSRWSLRRWLHVRRRRGDFTFRVLIIGTMDNVRELMAALAQRPDAGYRVIAAFITDVSDPDPIPGVRVRAANRGSLFEGLQDVSADTVVVVGSDDLSSATINELSWELDPGQQLVVAPQLVGVAGSRIHTRPVAGLPLIHVETPSYDGPKRFLKRAFDIVGSFLLIVMLAPVLLLTIILVALSSPGPIFYRQERIGLSGAPFMILKFRSMVTGADSRLTALLREQGTADVPLFKLANDPRVTPIGAILRRYSLDELPQLFNVLFGDMSLVGPRPQVDGEVRMYDSKSSRRLAVKPGMSGLWQVSGRSNLSWEDSIRLDLYYVENWSVTSDIVILLRTLRAVIGHNGAV